MSGKNKMSVSEFESEKARLTTELTEGIVRNVPPKYMPIIHAYVANLVAIFCTPGGELSLVSMTDAALLAIAKLDDDALASFTSSELVLAFINLTDHAARCHNNGLLDEANNSSNEPPKKTPSNVN